MTEVTIEVTSPPTLTISVEAPGTNTIEVSPAPVVEIGVNISGFPGISTDAGNTAIVGSDGLIMVPDDRVLRAGDTMTGTLRVATPVAPEHAANKGYVDGKVLVQVSAPGSPAVGQIWVPM